MATGPRLDLAHDLPDLAPLPRQIYRGECFRNSEKQSAFLNQRVNELWLKLRMDEGTKFDAPAEFFGATRATKNLRPIRELSAENCTEQMGVPGPWYERLPHFRMGFTPSAGKELQSEYFVPRENAVDALFAVERLRDRVGPHLLISEIRTIAADDLWMSPCYKRPALQFLSPGSRIGLR